MGAIYLKINGQWDYLYRAIDKDGDTLDFQLAKQRDLKAALRFFNKTIQSNPWPGQVAIDTSGAAALKALNTLV